MRPPAVTGRGCVSSVPSTKTSHTECVMLMGSAPHDPTVSTASFSKAVIHNGSSSTAAAYCQNSSVATSASPLLCITATVCAAAGRDCQDGFRQCADKHMCVRREPKGGIKAQVSGSSSGTPQRNLIPSVDGAFGAQNRCWPA